MCWPITARSTPAPIRRNGRRVFFNIVTGSYDFPTAYVAVDGIYTNKAPGGVAYRCSFRVTEAAYCIERAMDILAQKLKMDPAELRLKNFIKAEQFPYHSALGWEYDSGDYHTAMKKMMETVDYAGLRKQQGGAARGVSSRRDPRNHGRRRVVLHRDRRRRAVEELRHPRHCDVRLLRNPHASHRCRHRPRRLQRARARATRPTWAQIIATEIGIPADDIMVEEGNTDTAPYGLGTYGSRSHAGGGRRHRHGRAKDQGKGADDRRLQARGA